MCAKKRKIKLTPMERETEAASARGEYVPADPKELEAIARIIEARKKDAVLNIRLNRGDLENLKMKAKKLGVKYQTFIAEILHQIAKN